MLIDTHAHLYSEDFDNDRDLQVAQCLENGVKAILLPNIDVSSIDSMQQLCHKYPLVCFPMMGLHPCYVSPNNWIENLSIIKNTLFSYPKKYIAVGEIGIDLYWDKSTLMIQKEAFIEQIKWAKELQLPIVIHARESFDEIFEILDHYNEERLTGIFHCFTGTAFQAQKIIDYGGFKIGIGGVVTYKKSDLSAVIVKFDLNHFVLETDAPYLAPLPHRGKRNQPSYVSLVAKKMSEIFGVSEKEVAEITSKNAQNVFRLNLT